MIGLPQGLLSDISLDLQQHVRLPVVQFGDLVEFNDSSGKGFGVTVLYSVNQGIHKLGFTCRGERRVLSSVLAQVSSSSHGILKDSR